MSIEAKQLMLKKLEKEFNNTLSATTTDNILKTIADQLDLYSLEPIGESDLDIISNDSEKIWTISAEKWEVNQTDDDSFYQSKNNNDSINEDENENENENEYNIYKNNDSLRISRESQLIYNENNENEKWTQKEEQWIVDNNIDSIWNFFKSLFIG